MKKAGLMTYRWAKKEVEQLKELIETLQENADGLKAVRLVNCPTPNGGAGDTVGAAVAKLDDAVRRYTGMIDKLTVEMEEVEAAIERLEGVERDVMRARYILCKNWKTIGRDLSYSYTRLQQIHRSALKKLEEE